MIELTEYVGDERPGRQVMINIDEIAAVREYLYHSFRSAIGEVVLKCGEKIRVWETRSHVVSLITAARAAGGGE